MPLDGHSGPPIHGNYRGYYTKRPSVHDPRLALLPRGIFDNARVLDIGCNEGWVTCEIAQTSSATQVVGVDIDGGLVRAAWKHRRAVWSQRKPDLHATNPQSDIRAGDRPSKRRKRDDDNARDAEAAQSIYFPACFEHMYGPLPIPPRMPGSEARFPYNVTFRTADWGKTGVLEDGDGYDVVLGLSITKWIHLNEGDDGLKSFFQRVYKVLRPGGVFVLEPQEWETYAKAKRMDPKLKENAKTLTLRPDHFPQVLSDMGFRPAEHLGTTGKGGFRRPVDLYRKPV